MLTKPSATINWHQTSITGEIAVVIITEATVTEVHTAGTTFQVKVAVTARDLIWVSSASVDQQQRKGLRNDHDKIKAVINNEKGRITAKERGILEHSGQWTKGQDKESWVCLWQPLKVAWLKGIGDRAEIVDHWKGKGLCQGKGKVNWGERLVHC